MNNSAFIQRGSNTRVSIVALLRHNPASPPYTARKRRGQPSRQYRQRKQTPFVSPAPSQRRPRYMTPPSPPSCNPESFRNTPTLPIPLSTCSTGWQDCRSSYERSENIYSEHRPPKSCLHIKSLKSRLTGSQIWRYMQLVNLSGAVRGGREGT